MPPLKPRAIAIYNILLQKKGGKHVTSKSGQRQKQKKEINKELKDL